MSQRVANRPHTYEDCEGACARLECGLSVDDPIHVIGSQLMDEPTLRRVIWEKAHKDGISEGWMKRLLEDFAYVKTNVWLRAARFVSEDEHMVLYWRRQDWQRYKQVHHDDVESTARYVGLLLSERVALGTVLRERVSA